MENNETREFEFSFLAIFKIFKGKLKAILIVLLVAAILGGAFGTFILLFTQRFHGNLLTFYLPIAEESSYSNILPLIESDVFLQKVLIDTTEETYVLKDEQGVPLKDENGNMITEVIRVPNLPFSAEEKEDFKKYTALKIRSQRTIDELKQYFIDSPYERSVLLETLDRKRSDYSTAVSLLNTYMAVQDSTVADKTANKIEELERQRNEAAAAKDLAEAEYNASIDEYQANTLICHTEKVNIRNYEEKLDDILAPLYTEWKTDTKNAKTISLVEEGLEFSFSKNELFPDENGEIEADKNPSRKFLHVKISLSNNKELAEKLIHNIHTEMEDFIVSHSSPSNSNEIIKVKCVSVPVSSTTFSSSIIITLAKYVILFAALGVVVFISVILANHFKQKYLPLLESANDETSGDGNGNENENGDNDNKNDSANDDNPAELNN